MHQKYFAIGYTSIKRFNGFYFIGK